jgi:hypothetical protein
MMLLPLRGRNHSPVTVPQSNGVGTAESVLYDQCGRIGRAAQALLISQRP